MKKKTGILMPVASLPNRHGVGDFGKEAYEFVDLLKETGVKLWQILPLNPLGFGKSPYQPYSSKALDEIYINLDKLSDMFLCEKIEDFNPDGIYIDYDGVKNFKEPYLKKAFENFMKNKEKFKKLFEDFEEFKKQNWLFDYAAFITFKKNNEEKCWNQWDEKYKNYSKTKDSLLIEKHRIEIEYEMFLQFILFKQFQDLKKYANERNILIIGDVPFYCGIDSDDVYFNQEEYLLYKDGRPKFIAGVPPDYFSPTGQRWGNPIYNWEKMEENDYKTWFERLEYTSKLYDIIRLDHFRAFDTFWKIDGKCDTAIDGEWIENKGEKFFKMLFEKQKDIQLIAEDLGDIRPQVISLMEMFKLKGMRVLQFSLDVNDDNLGKVNEVCYSGTHDNDTLFSWYNKKPVLEKQEIENFLRNKGYDSENIIDSLVMLALNGKSVYCIIPLADVMCLDDSARLNTPGTLGAPNWMWRITDYKKVRKDFRKFKIMLEKAKR